MKNKIQMRKEDALSGSPVDYELKIALKNKNQNTNYDWTTTLQVN